MPEQPADADRTLTHERQASDRPADVPLASRFTPGTILAGRYRIVAPLGSGGAGEVYRAEDMKLGQTVALKFVSARIAREKALLDRIVAEVRIGRQVSHPNLCRIYDMGEVDDQYFITMEYVDGENLSSLLRRVGRLPEDKALEVAREICAALAAAHDRGVVHRDVKPANVMIDGRGHARITDFGLAVAHGDTSADTFAGTPAYMAPEQLEGQEATEQSDIYALGLLLYEVFTGQRLFSGTLTEIAAAHRRPKRPPSTITRGLSPAIERVILQCIQELPEDRPDSVRDVLAALPGGDPLRAAIAAGETPSPRDVAAAETVGELPVSTAWTLLAVVLLFVAAIAWASRSTMLYKQAPLPSSPDVLTERARQVIRAAGYPVNPTGSRRWMGKDVDVLRAAVAGRTIEERPAILGRVSPLRFGYRESPRALVPQSRGAIVTATDPPVDVPGMVLVLLDSRGQLIRFVRSPETAAGPAAPVDWSSFFSFAGIDAEKLTADDSAWVSPVDGDRKSAWRGYLPSDPHLAIDVHAASVAGKPVYFDVAIHPRDAAARPRASAAGATATEQFTGVVGFAIVFIAGLVVAAIVARRNIRLGRGDRAAARRVGLIVFATTFLAGLLSADHTSDAAGEWGLLVGIAGNSLYQAGSFWLFYMAAEPYVRRRQPELLISWNRVVRGYFRDALVGRHVLYGCLLGALMNLCYAHLLVLVPTWLGLPPPLPDHSFPEKLAGSEWPLVSLSALLGSVPMQSVGALFIFSAIRSLVRNSWIAAGATTILSTLPFLGRDVAPRAEVLFVVITAALFIVALCRIGLLAGMVALFVAQWLNTSLFVFDTSSWLFVPTLIYVSVLAGVVLYGFSNSLGSKPMLGRLRVAE